MKTDFLKDRQKRTFTGIGGAKEWKTLDYAVDRIRLKLVSRQVVEVADLTSEVKRESIDHGLDKRMLRVKLRDVLLEMYDTPTKKTDMDSPAFCVAISPS
jgi:hypothetical protein